MENKINKSKEEYYLNYANIFNVIKSPIITIDKANYNIETNQSFKNLLEVMNFPRIIKKSEKDISRSKFSFEDFSKNNIENLKDFFELENQEDFKNFLKEINIKIEYDFKSEKQISERKLKKLIFVKKIFFLNKMLNSFIPKNSADKIGSRKSTNKMILNDILNTFFVKTGKFNDNFINAGEFIIPKSKNNLSNLSNMTNNQDKINSISTVEIQYQKTKINDLELMNIIINDTTDHTNFEEEKVLNKVKKDYLSNVAHEFKSPIQVLILIVREIASKFTDLKNDMIEKFNEVDHLGNYILLLILDIISFAKEEIGMDIRFNIIPKNQPFEFGLSILKLLIKNNSMKAHSISTVLFVDPRIPAEINCDEMRLNQVLVNFISNAYKFTYMGKISIRADLIKSNSFYDEILVSIEDTGIGIKPEDRKKIFKQFGKLEDINNINRQGTGLGLVICNKIVSRIGNIIGYEPKEVGSKFYFSFYNVKSDLIIDKIEQSKEILMEEVISYHADAIKDDVTKIEKLNLSQERPKYLKSPLHIIKNRLKTKNFDIVYRIDKLVSSLSIYNNSLNNLDQQLNLPSHLISPSIQIPIQYHSEKLDGALFANKFSNTVKTSQSSLASKINLQDNEEEDEHASKKSRLLEGFELNLNKNLLSNFKINADDEDDDDSEEDDTHKRPKSNKNKNSARMKNNSKKSLSSSGLGLPSEVFQFYQVVDTEAGNTIKIEKPDNKRLNFFLDMFSLCEDMYKNKNEEFEKIYQSFKPYLKFFVDTLNSSSLNSFHEKICIVDDNRVIVNSAKNLICKYVDKEGINCEVIKATDGVVALALFQIDYCYKKTIKYFITDENMNFMNGGELLRLIHQYDKEKGIKLYICSADNENYDSKQLSTNNIELISKPLGLSDVKKILNKK